MPPAQYAVPTLRGSSNTPAPALAGVGFVRTKEKIMSAEIFNAFNNSWPIVQVFMLLIFAITAGLLITAPCWMLFRTLADIRDRKTSLAPNTLLSVALEDDIVVLKIRKDAPLTAQEVVSILPMLSEDQSVYPPAPKVR